MQSNQISCLNETRNFSFFKYRTFDFTANNLNPVKNFTTRFSKTYYTTVHLYMSAAHQISKRKFCICLSFTPTVLHVPPTPQFLIKPAQSHKAQLTLRMSSGPKHVCRTPRTLSDCHTYPERRITALGLAAVFSLDLGLDRWTGNRTLTEALAVFLRQLYTFPHISSSFTAILTFCSTSLTL